MPCPLIVTESRLNQHFQNSGTILQDAVDASVQLDVDYEFVSPGAIGGLYGTGCEFIPRNRGRPVAVAPLIHLDKGVWVWLGYHEEWEEERRNRHIRRFSFRSVGLTVHFGVKNNQFKPQMFRAEWAGWARWNGPDYSFQAIDAGHPHWQFDALDSLPDDDFSGRAAKLLSRLKAEAGSQIRDFSPQLATVEVRDVVTAQKLSNIHFASAAAWWKSSPHGDHAHGPANIADIETWVKRSLEYLKVELARL